MRIRSASRTEVGLLDAIAMEAKAHWGYKSAQLDEWRPSLLTEPQSIETWPTFVAEMQGRSVGFAQVNPEGSSWELISLWVLPAYMGKGIGRALLQRVAQAARKANQAVVRIDSDPNAEAFYVACGAVVIGTVPAPIAEYPSRVRPQLELKASAA